MPLTLGYFKPVVLIPFGLLTSIPQDEIEVILLHELAHIRRKDYAVNIFQCIVEIFFFFNPAVIWLSSLIRTEWENCCDDLVVNQTGNKWNYIKALMSFGEIQSTLPKYAPALSGSNNHLLNCAKRLIHNHNKNIESLGKDNFIIRAC